MEQEAICRAYVQAIAARAGLISSRPDPDLGIDLCLRAVRHDSGLYADTGLQIDLQLRSTTRANVSNNVVRYDIDVRTYNYLRELPILCPRLLVVLVLPEDETQWLGQSVDELILRHCAYWASLEKAAPTTATSSIRIVIPRTQVFSVRAANMLLDQLKRGRTS